MSKLPAPELPSWLRVMLPTGIERYCIDVGGYRMHVMEHGRGRPVLLLHGNPTWGFLYRRVVERVTGEAFRMVMPDLIGLGFSDKPSDARVHQLDNHGRWLGRLIDSLGIDNFILVVQDWGGPIGLRALYERRGRLGGLVVLNTAVGPPRPGFKPTSFHRFARMPVISDAVFRLLGFPQNLLALTQGDRASIGLWGEVSRAYRYPLRHRRDRVAPLALARMVPDSLDHPSVEPLRKCETFLREYDGPAAIVWGDRDPILGRLRKRVAEILPQADVTATDAGHFLQEEVPIPIAEAIRRVALQMS